MTTSFLDETSGAVPLPPAPGSRHQTAHLSGRSDRQRQSGSRRASRGPNASPAPRDSRHDPRAPPPGTRQLLDQLGPEKFAEWTRSQKRLLLTDTTFRDAHQSLLATRVRTYDLLAIAELRRASASRTLFSLEMWGGATFDVAMRFLLEDPWQRLRRLREAIPNICFQMLLRASNAVGYTAYPDNVVREFIREAAAQGIDIFRIFDSLNWLPNMKVADGGGARRPDAFAKRPSATPATFSIRRATNIRSNTTCAWPRNWRRMGAHILAIKDMAGLCKPMRRRSWSGRCAKKSACRSTSTRTIPAASTPRRF